MLSHLKMCKHKKNIRREREQFQKRFHTFKVISIYLIKIINILIIDESGVGSNNLKLCCRREGEQSSKEKNVASVHHK